MITAFIPGEQRQNILFDGEPLGDVDTSKNMFIANRRGQKQDSFCPPLPVFGSGVIVPNGTETRPVWVADERMLVVFKNKIVPVNLLNFKCVRDGSWPNLFIPIWVQWCGLRVIGINNTVRVCNGFTSGIHTAPTVYCKNKTKYRIQCHFLS